MGLPCLGGQACQILPGRARLLGDKTRRDRVANGDQAQSRNISALASESGRMGCSLRRADIGTQRKVAPSPVSVLARSLAGKCCFEHQNGYCRPSRPTNLQCLGEPALQKRAFRSGSSSAEPVRTATRRSAARLLAARRKRPGNRRAPEKRDELAPFHGRPLQQATLPYHVAG